MKYTLLFISSLFIFSCQSREEKKSDCTQIEFNTSFTAIIDDEICLPDGSSITIMLATDEFCPCDAICKWSGELAIEAAVVTASGEKSDYRFGSKTYQLNPIILPNVRIESFTYLYETGPLPDCENDFNPEKLQLILKLIEE